MAGAMKVPGHFYIRDNPELTADGERTVNLVCAKCDAVILSRLPESRCLNAVAVVGEHWREKHPELAESLLPTKT